MSGRFRQLFKPHPESLPGQLNAPTYLRWQAGIQAFALVAPVKGPMVPGFSWSWMLPTLLSVPQYLFFYLRLHVAPQRQMPFHAVTLILSGMRLWPFNPFAFIDRMIATMALALHPSWRLWLVAVLATALISVPMAYLPDSLPGALAIIAMASLFGGFSHLLYMRGARRDVELRLSRYEVRRPATLAERKRIGRDLDDLLGHTLLLVALRSELVRRLALRDPSAARRAMEEVERVARHPLTEVRAAVTGMRRGDLAAELVSARLMLEASGISLACEAPESLLLSHQIEAPLALVLREAVTNIHRPARATAARVSLSSDTSECHMQISDNGRGGLAAHGNGVSGMRERVRALGGVLAIDSPARKGATLDVRVPLAGLSTAAPGTFAQAPVAIGSAA